MSFAAALSMDPSLPASAAGVSGTLGVIGFAFTTSLNSINAAYAAFAPASFAVDTRYGGSALAHLRRSL